MGSFFSAVIVQVLSEMQDRNFEVILFLSSWSPVYGMREETRLPEAMMVVAGAFMALAVRLLVFYFLTGSGVELIVTNLSIILAPVMLWFLTVRAYQHYHTADEFRAVQVQATLSHAVTQPKAVENVEMGAVPPQPSQEPLTDGSQLETVHAPDGSQLAPFERGPISMAFVVTFCCTFAVSLSDPLGGARYLDNLFGIFASALGSLLAAIVAVVAGTTLEHVLSDRRFLLSAAVVMMLSATASTSRLVLLSAFGESQVPTPAP